MRDDERNELIGPWPRGQGSFPVSSDDSPVSDGALLCVSCGCAWIWCSFRLVCSVIITRQMTHWFALKSGEKMKSGAETTGQLVNRKIICDAFEDCWHQIICVSVLNSIYGENNTFGGVIMDFLVFIETTIDIKGQLNQYIKVLNYRVNCLKMIKVKGWVFFIFNTILMCY